MPVKRPVDDDDDGAGNGQLHPHMPAVKASRHDLQQHQQQQQQQQQQQHQHQDYDAHHQQHAAQQQASARKKGVSNRTGQACDRCKTRKIRCDPQPGGCSPCAQNNTECRTTDRITGLARSRGHAENLEGEVASLRAHNESQNAQIESLKRQLRDNGLEPVHAPAVSAAYANNVPTDSQSQPSPVEPATSSWGTLHQPKGDSTPAQGVLLSEFRTGCIGDNYLGVSSGNSWLSPIEGTSVSLFGATLDLAEYIPEDHVDSGTSYQNFLNKAFVEEQRSPPQLPDWPTAKMYAEWYFRSIQPMLPILHKPHFMQLLYDVYHENHQSTPAELVMVHMVMSLVLFQYNTRNARSSQNFQHWHFSLSMVTTLMKGHTLQDMQGLALVCAQLRAFPRPGACWMFTNTTLGLAIELGLHRSAKAWQGNAAHQDPHTIELRKRIFWSLMMMHVPVSGKLGRPMPLRLEDFDIEIPEEAHDYLPEEAHLDEWRKCSFRSGIWGFVLLKVQMKVYSSIYSIGSNTATYDANVKLLEKELKDTVAAFPEEINGGPKTKDEDRVTALYLQLGATGCQLLIHHPALCRSLSSQVMSDNLDACLNASHQMLSIATNLKRLNSLDSTLYWNMDFLASMFTMLFVYTERRDRLTVNDLRNLRQAMKGWLDVMGFVGNLLGTGDRLHVALCNLVEGSLNTISSHLAQKTATAAVASTATPPAPEHPQQRSQPPSQKQTPVYENGHDYNHSYANGAPQEQTPVRNTHQVQVQPHPPPQQQTPQPPRQPSQQSPHQIPHQQPPPHQPQVLSRAADNGYQNNPTYSYAGAQGSNVPSFAPTIIQAYHPQGYASEDVKPNLDAQLVAHAAMAQQVSQPAANNYMMYQPAPAYNIDNTMGQQVSWRNFADTLHTGMQASAPGMADGSLANYSGMVTEAPMVNITAKGGTFMYSNGASFGQMQMPPQDGSNNVAEWPMVQY
ncbi:hypothetical protein Q7P35_005976 [Cladosporium inversicolor]